MSNATRRSTQPIDAIQDRCHVDAGQMASAKYRRRTVLNPPEVEAELRALHPRGALDNNASGRRRLVNGPPKLLLSSTPALVYAWIFNRAAFNGATDLRRRGCPIQDPEFG